MPRTLSDREEEGIRRPSLVLIEKTPKTSRAKCKICREVVAVNDSRLMWVHVSPLDFTLAPSFESVIELISAVRSLASATSLTFALHLLSMRTCDVSILPIVVRSSPSGFLNSEGEPPPQSHLLALMQKVRPAVTAYLSGANLACSPTEKTMLVARIGCQGKPTKSGVLQSPLLCGVLRTASNMPQLPCCHCRTLVDEPQLCVVRSEREP